MTARAIVLLEREGVVDVARWATAAAAIVLAAHLGLMATYLLFYSQPPAGAPKSPAVVIDLAPLPVAPASPMDVAPGPEMVEAPPPPQPEVVEPKPEPIIEPPPPALEPLVALPEPAKEPSPAPQVKEAPRPTPPEVKRVERTPAPRTTASPRSERATAEKPSAPSPGAVSASAAMASWRDQVVAQLQRAKRYPSGAQSRREQGVVMLSFTLSRGGSVLARSIVRSSGNSELDQEALAMIMRAQPFPPFPASMPQAQVRLPVPINFSLR